MMNLFFYLVEGGNVYFYYVFVIVNYGFIIQFLGVNFEYYSIEVVVCESRKEKDDVIYIDDSDDDIYSDVKEELFEFEELCFFRESVGGEIFCGVILFIFEKN